MNFQGFLKQSTAVTVTILMIDSSDHITGKTGLAAGLTVYQSKAGAATGAITPTSVTEIDSTNAKGLYALALNTTSWTNTLGEMILHITATGADPADYKWWVTARLPDDLAFPATTGRSMVVDASGLCDSNMVKAGPTGSGTAQTAGDIYSKVSGLTYTVALQVDCNVKDWAGTAVSAPATAGIPEVNVKNMNNVSAASITAINANQGTTQPVNFHGTAGSAYVKGDLVEVNDATVSAASAQLGVNVVQINAVSAAAVTTVKAVQGLTTADTITAYTGNTPQTGDAYARLGTPIGVSVSADIAAIRTDTNTTIPNLIAALNNISSANVKTQVVAALATDTYAEPAQGAPAATTTLAVKIGFLYKAWRNRTTMTASQYSLYNDDAATVDHKASFSDDATTADKGEVATGP